MYYMLAVHAHNSMTYACMSWTRSSKYVIQIRIARTPMVDYRCLPIYFKASCFKEGFDSSVILIHLAIGVLQEVRNIDKR